MKESNRKRRKSYIRSNIIILYIINKLILILRNLHSSFLANINNSFTKKGIYFTSLMIYPLSLFINPLYISTKTIIVASRNDGLF